MSWISKLYDTYTYCESIIGKEEPDTSAVLLPIAHTTQIAHIELSIDEDGNFLKGTARVLEDKAERVTIIPCTEESQARTSGYCAHPLFDKLMYVAGDYVKYGGEKGSEPYNDYIENLRKWCTSEYSNPKACAILKYLEKGCLIEDMISEDIIPVDENGNVIRKWDKNLYGEKRGVYCIGAILSDALDAFVRINVHKAWDETEVKTWKDRQLNNDFVNYYCSTQSGNDLCYVTGINLSCASMSPGKIRNSADKAKLISANDSSGFTFRGRFENDGQTYRIGYEVTQKAHNALKWLIDKQGFRNGDQVFVIWGTKNEPIPPIEQNSEDAFSMLEPSDETVPHTETVYAKKINKMLLGYSQKLTDRSEVVVLGLDSATQGRLSITYYSELAGSDFLSRVRSWYESCWWRMSYIKKNDNYIKCVCSPSLLDIVFAAYGRETSDKLKKSTIQRLMPCIIDNKKIPEDILNAAVRNASNPIVMSDYDKRKTLEIACAIIRHSIKNSKGDKYGMAVDYNNHERSYLFGRVLAYYHYIEYRALQTNGADRPTNAMRLQSVYAKKPASTLKYLDNQVNKYVNRMGNIFNSKRKELQSVLSELDGNNCENITDKPLDATYLIGYSSQLNELFEKKEQKDEEI